MSKTDNTQPVDLAAAMYLVQANSINRVTIECFDGRRFAILMHGRADFVLKSERQNPRAFVGVEAAMKVVRSLGLRSASLDFAKWDPNQKTI